MTAIPAWALVALALHLLLVLVVVLSERGWRRVRWGVVVLALPLVGWLAWFGWRLAGVFELLEEH